MIKNIIQNIKENSIGYQTEYDEIFDIIEKRFTTHVTSINTDEKIIRILYKLFKLQTDLMVKLSIKHLLDEVRRTTNISPYIVTEIMADVDKEVLAEAVGQFN